MEIFLFVRIKNLLATQNKGEMGRTSINAMKVIECDECEFGYADRAGKMSLHRRQNMFKSSGAFSSSL